MHVVNIPDATIGPAADVIDQPEGSSFLNHPSYSRRYPIGPSLRCKGPT